MATAPSQTEQPSSVPDPASDNTPQDLFDDGLPAADELLARLNAIDLKQLDIEEVSAQMLGPWKWARVLVMPVGALLLFLFTWLLSALSGYLIPSFILVVVLLIFLGRLLDRYEHALKLQARQAIEQRIAEIEGESGLLIYFRDFLPKKYKPLLKALEQGFYGYIPQYIEAVKLLHAQLDPIKFQTWWLIKREQLATIGKPTKYYTSRAERLLLLSDDDLAKLLEAVKEKDILNMLLLTHNEQLARRVLNLLSLMIAQNIKTALLQVEKLNTEQAKVSTLRILETGKKLARSGELSVEPDFFD